MAVSGHLAPGFLQAFEERLDYIAQCVNGAVDEVLDFVIGGDLWGRAVCAQIATDIDGVLAISGEHDLRVGFSPGHQGVEGVQ